MAIQPPEQRQYRESIHGFIASYNEESRYGVNYLRNDLQAEEARVYFEQARAKGQADFEDEIENNYTVIYNRDGTYTIVFRGKHK